ILGIGLLAEYYYILPTNINTANENIFFRHILLILATFLMFIWTPFINVKISNKNIWEWTQNFILILLSTIVYSFLLYAGISLALYAIERLFSIEIPSRRYAQLVVLVFGIYGVNLFLSQIPKYIILLQVRTYTKVEEIFTKYILTSLTIGYFLIIFVYSTKILITMQWPTGVVAWISVIFSIVAITTYLFWTPLWYKENIKFKRFIWLAVLFQTIMLGLSIWMRIEEYGITESRYFIALFGVWLLFMSLYFIFIKNASYKWLFVTLTILIIGSQFGKYSAIEVSKRDQIIRLEKLIDNSYPISPSLDNKTKKNIYSKIEYLYRVHGVDSLKTVIPKIVDKYHDLNSSSNKYFPIFATTQLRLGKIPLYNSRFFTINKPREVIDIHGYKYLIRLQYDRNSKKSLPSIDNNLSIEIKNTHLYIIENNETITNISLDNFVKSLNHINNDYTELSNNRMIYNYQDSKIKTKILLNAINISEDNNISSIYGYMLLSKN
ncbi:MAG: DUF4153 domain-containing protein, partial [Sulfurovaceae bacterium]|nr:DUF4153 domain-containing protein [Sulfurovaceae bacterium]